MIFVFLKKCSFACYDFNILKAQLNFNPYSTVYLSHKKFSPFLFSNIQGKNQYYTICWSQRSKIRGKSMAKCKAFRELEYFQSFWSMHEVIFSSIDVFVFVVSKSIHAESNISINGQTYEKKHSLIKLLVVLLYEQHYNCVYVKVLATPIVKIKWSERKM